MGRGKLVLTEDLTELRICKKELEDTQVRLLKQQMALDTIIRKNRKGTDNISKIRLEIAGLQKNSSILIAESVQEMLDELDK